MTNCDGKCKFLVAEMAARILGRPLAIIEAEQHADDAEGELCLVYPVGTGLYPRKDWAYYRLYRNGGEKYRESMPAISLHRLVHYHQDQGCILSVRVK